MTPRTNLSAAAIIVTTFLPAFAQSVATDQDERPISGLAVKAGGAIEHDCERLHPYFRGGLACRPKAPLGQAAEKEQRDVQAFRFDGSAVKSVGAFEHARQPINPGRRARIGNDCEK